MATWKFLDYKNRQDGSLNQDDLENPDCDSSPVLFPDETTPVKFVFEASLAQVTKMLSALEKGAQLSYPNEWHNVWWSFVQNLECKVTICEEVAQCFTDENEALMIAVAAALQNNPTLLAGLSGAISNLGSGVPGQPLTTSQSSADFLPANVKPDDECDNDALWGACLYLVQSGNRAITDFFEDIEAASNTLETSAIVAETIPAAGDYAAAAANFADQLQENLTEGYAAAYTENYEEQLACEIFCAARAADCTLGMDTLIDIMNERLPDPAEVTSFGLVMTRIGTGIFSGQEIADAAFLIYFTALKFGQQFGSTIGIRPLTDLMSLGADQLASDNWETLCDCDIEPTFVVQANIDPTLSPPGQDSGFDVEEGISYTLSAAGAWSGGGITFGPGGDPAYPPPIPTAVCSACQGGSLIARIDSGAWFQVGEFLEFEADATGTLYFAFNDVPLNYGDNTGSVTVTFTPA